MSPELHPREARLAAKQKVDAALTEARTQLAKLRCERDAMVIALRKGELIKRYDAKVALGFLLTGMRQRLMSLAYALPRRLLGQSEHAIGQIVDAEVRGALRDIASWPERMANPAWSENIDEDLCPPPEVGGNGDDGGGGGAVKQESAAAQRERRNSLRRERYAAKTKEI
jgi:hypothetical protein